MGKCQSCGMPMESDNLYCQYCTDAQGNLLPRATVEEKMIQFYVSAMNDSYQDAAVKVKDLMSKMPAWQDKEVMPEEVPAPPAGEVNPPVDEVNAPVGEVSPSLGEPMPQSEETVSPLSETVPEPPAPEPMTETAEPVLTEDGLQPSSAEPQTLPEQGEEQSS